MPHNTDVLRLVKAEPPEEVINRVARRIAELRSRAGLTQLAVAERIGTTVSNYQRIEHGLQNVTLKTMARIAGAIGVKTVELLQPLEAPEAKRRRGRPSSRQA